MSTIYDVVQEICLGLPGTEESVSHGFPNFKVAGKTFATYSLNHHGDEKVALLLNFDRGTQAMLVESAPLIFFVPPYSGTKGWLGIELDKGLKWERVAQLTWEAYCRTAPTGLGNSSAPVAVKPPTKKVKPEDINPMKSKKNQALLKKLREVCLSLPEVIEDKQFGNPNFRAGKKGFCNISARQDKTTLQIWVGPLLQDSYSSVDKRFHVPPYAGHRGWIDLNITSKQDWAEIRKLVLVSYEHFALKRMLNALQT